MVSAERLMPVGYGEAEAAAAADAPKWSAAWTAGGVRIK
jgi:hypothetical protein